MGNKLVIRIPAVLLLFVVCLSISKVIAVKGIQLPLPTVITDLIDKKVAAEIITKAKPHTNLSEMEQIVNGIRVDNQLSVLKMNEEVCANFSTWNQPSAESVFSVCENCRHVAIVKISSIARPAQIQEYLDGDRSAKVILQNPELTHMCLKEKNDMHTVYVMKYDTAETTTTSRSNANEPKVYYPTSNPELEVNNFSEEELWSALTIYRQSQQRADLNRDEKLCEYARKRVQDHTRDFATKDPSEYPNPEKYPLDAHAGFAADADSGSAFEMTDKNKLAENLAYWPSATDPIHVIEWGWDTSTEGHRETQLSNEYSSACIAGQDGFYVAIFGD